VHVTHVGYDQNTGEFTVRLSPLKALGSMLPRDMFSCLP
jgi:hypothetical protein